MSQERVELLSEYLAALRGCLEILSEMEDRLFETDAFLEVALAKRAVEKVVRLLQEAIDDVRPIK